jgi:hypothetical protein
VIRNQGLKLSDQGRAPVGAKVGLDPLLHTRETQLLQAGNLGLRKRLVREVGKGPSSPQRKSHPRLPIVEEPLEALEVELPLADPQPVAGRLRLDPLPAEQLAQLRDVDLQSFPTCFRRLLLPQRIDQPVGRDDLVRVQEQNRQQRPLLGATNVDRPIPLEYLERPEDSELHSRDRTTRSDGLSWAV